MCTTISETLGPGDIAPNFYFGVGQSFSISRQTRHPKSKNRTVEIQGEKPGGQKIKDHGFIFSTFCWVSNKDHSKDWWFCVDYVNYRFILDMSIYNDLYIKCHFTKPEHWRPTLPMVPMTWQWQMPQAFLVQRVRAMRWNGSYSPIDSWQLLGRVSAGPGCWRVLVRLWLWLLWIPEVLLGKLHMRLKQKSLEGREFRDKWYVD